jgi:uncharacterized membrane protein YdjX (TVP38/TMEM64 family)
VSGALKDESERAPTQGYPWLGIVLSVAGLVVLGLLVLAVEPLRTGVGDALHGDTDALRSEIRSLGVWGGLLVLALALAHAVIWYPAEILDAAAGFVYGFWVALPLVVVGWILNAIVAYEIGRHAARPLASRLVGRERLLRAEFLIERGGATLLLAVRLIPIAPFSLFSYAAGAVHVPRGRFLWTTVVGYLPITVVFVYVGSQLESLSLSDPIVWIGAIMLLVLLVAGRYVSRSLREPVEPPAGERDRA